MSQIAKKIILAIKKEADSQKAKHLQRFFKTGPEEYGEGDLFLGLTVPTQRSIVKDFKNRLNLKDLKVLIVNPYHEVRLVGLLLLVEFFKKASNQLEKKVLVDFYLDHSSYINNWDLVDLSAYKIVGQYLFEINQEKKLQKTPKLLGSLAKSDLLWDRRIAILSTFPFVRAGQFLPTLELAKILINDQEDLMHKAVGWLLREVGKRDEQVLTAFLDEYTLEMPRTMLRYAIEKFPEKKRQFYLKKT
jgi:3-methyladenine DNA glycosylase AlkD